MQEKSIAGTWTIPNILSASRIGAAPVLLLLAWFGFHDIFRTLLVLTLLTDALDGFLARRWNQTSELGARLDSWGDLAIYFTLPLCIWWLWPELVLEELGYILVIVASYLLPILVALIKFGGITSYHTWLVKAAVVVVGGAVLIMLFGGPVWPLHLAAPVAMVAGIEEILITLLLPQRLSDIPTLWHALRLGKQS